MVQLPQLQRIWPQVVDLNTDKPVIYFDRIKIHIHSIDYVRNIPCILNIPGIHYAVKKCYNIPALKEEIREILKTTLADIPGIPTGRKNGLLKQFVGSSNYTAAERDFLYDNGINTIIDNVSVGYMLMGQFFVYKNKIQTIINSFNSDSQEFGKINSRFISMTQHFNARIIAFDVGNVIETYEIDGNFDEVLKDLSKLKNYSRIDFYKTENYVFDDYLNEFEPKILYLFKDGKWFILENDLLKEV